MWKIARLRNKLQELTVYVKEKDLATVARFAINSLKREEKKWIKMFLENPSNV